MNHPPLGFIPGISPVLDMYNEPQLHRTQSISTSVIIHVEVNTCKYYLFLVKLGMGSLLVLPHDILYIYIYIIAEQFWCAISAVPSNAQEDPDPQFLSVCKAMTVTYFTVEYGRDFAGWLPQPFEFMIDAATKVPKGRCKKKKYV